MFLLFGRFDLGENLTLPWNRGGVCVLLMDLVCYECFAVRSL